MDEFFPFITTHWQYFTTLTVVAGGAIYARDTARKKNTTDLLLHSRSDTKLTEHYRDIHKIDRDDDKDMQTFARKDQIHTDEAKAIRYVLNHWEHIAVGMNRGIYSRKILKETSFTTVLTIYRKTKTFIDKVNTVEDKKTIYQEFRRLAKKWEQSPLRIKDSPWYKKVF